MRSGNDGSLGPCRRAVHRIDDPVDVEGYTLKWH